jgi:hypothetical protein
MVTLTNLIPSMLRTANHVPPEYLDPRIESLPPPPPPQGDFSGRLDGVIVMVSAGYEYLAKACCASIRQSLGEIPITLLVNGSDTDTAELLRLPKVGRIVAQEAAGVEAEQLWAGFWAKLLVHWISPYERFLYLDADALIWGDVRAYAEFDQYDFIAGYRFKSPIRYETREEVQQSVFDVDAIRQFDPALDWRGQEAANAGVFFARRGVFAKEQLVALRQLDCWRCYDNGVLNYLLWRASREGVPRIGGHRLQLFPAEPSCNLEDRFLPRDCKRPVVIHWVTKKPRLGRRYRAADDYRKLFLKMTGRSKWLGLRLVLEDLNVWFRRRKRSVIKRLRRNAQIPNKLSP